MTSAGPSPFVLPPPARQTFMHEGLVTMRASVLRPTLLSTLASLDPTVISNEMNAYAPAPARGALAAVGIRDDLVFVVPCVLEARPSLLGYYRLLLGVSQKQFYGRRSGLGRFKTMEMGNRLRTQVAPLLPHLCESINDAMGQMVTTLTPSVSVEDIEQLPLLALGAQLDGSWRTRIGDKATKMVFARIKEIIASCGVTFVETDLTSLSLTNSSGREVKVALAADPDVVIQEEAASGILMLKVAIEIKGGTDQSNAHNRAGEAEKSHRKVSNDARDFWTVISYAGMDLDVLKRESPTTRQWFDVGEVDSRAGTSWTRLQDEVKVAIGI
jgi:hypothetical protein